MNQETATSEKRYDPTSYFFNFSRWFGRLTEQQKQDHLYVESGKLIGETLLSIDKSFDRLKKMYDLISKAYLISEFDEYCIPIIQRTKKHSNDEFIRTIEVTAEAFLLILKTLNTTTSSGAEFIEKVHFSEMIALASHRNYLVQQWQRIEIGTLKLTTPRSPISLFKIIDLEREFGKSIAAARYQRHVFQSELIIDREQPPLSLANLLRKLPVRIVQQEDDLSVYYRDSNEEDFKRFLVRSSQFPYHYLPFIEHQFLNYKEVNLHTVLITWHVLSIFSSIIQSSSENSTSKYSTYTGFTKSQLTNLIQTCTALSSSASERTLAALTQTKRRPEDMYLKPIFGINDLYYLTTTTLLTGQFSQVANYFFHHEIMNTPGNDLAKIGYHFEKAFTKELQGQVDCNRRLSGVFCKVFHVNLKEGRGSENEEIDIVIRIGSSYVLIEAKSFSFGYDYLRYQSNYKRLENSNTARKRQMFIREYEKFKRDFDTTADFELDESKIYITYLTSIPQCVGIAVNDTKVLDSSLFERYFGSGDIELLDNNGNWNSMSFYKNGAQAEENISSYLTHLPPLREYFNGIKKTMNSYQFGSSNRQFGFEELFIDDSAENSRRTAHELRKELLQ
jgi:hypothetical protein